PRALLEAAKTHLLSVWERGSSADVADAMAKFRETYERNLLDYAGVDRNNTKAFREWKGRISACFMAPITSELSMACSTKASILSSFRLDLEGLLLLLYLAID